MRVLQEKAEDQCNSIKIKLTTTNVVKEKNGSKDSVRPLESRSGNPATDEAEILLTL